LRVRPSFGCGTAKTSGGDLPDGASEIFSREGLDRFSRATTDLPDEANQGC
jgi:hypothetical protein